MANDIQKIKEMKQLYLNVFDSGDGKKLLEELSKKCFIHRPTFSKDSLTMAFNEGQRSIILHINSVMNINVEETERLMKKQEDLQKGEGNVE